MLLTVASSLTLPIRVISGSRLRVPDIVALLYVHCTLRRRQVGRVLRPLTEGLLRLVLPSLSLCYTVIKSNYFIMFGFVSTLDLCVHVLLWFITGKFRSLAFAVIIRV